MALLFFLFFGSYTQHSNLGSDKLAYWMKPLFYSVCIPEFKREKKREAGIRARLKSADVVCQKALR